MPRVTQGKRPFALSHAWRPESPNPYDKRALPPRDPSPSRHLHALSHFDPSLELPEVVDGEPRNPSPACGADPAVVMHYEHRNVITSRAIAPKSLQLLEYSNATRVIPNLS